MTQGLPDTTRMVVRTGAPTDEETVAILLALDAATRADAPAPTPSRRPAWVAAARQEGVGGGPTATRTDLGRWA